MAGTNAPGSQYFGIGEETTYGTPVLSGRLLEVETDTFKREVIQDIREGFRKGVQTTPSDRNRTVMTGAMGTIELPLYFRGMGILLRSAFAKPAGSKQAWAKNGSTPVYDGSYRTDIDGQRKSYTFMMNRADYDGDLTKVFYSGMTCTNFGVNVSEGEALKITLEYAGAGESLDAISGTEGSYPTIDSWFHYDDTLVTVENNATMAIKSFTLDCDFGLNSDLRYLTGPGAAARAKPARGAIPAYTGTLETNMIDMKMHTAWTAGDMIAITLAAKHPFVVSNTTYYYEFKISMPNCLVTDAAPESSVGDFTQQSINFKVMHGVSTPADAITLTYSTRDSTE